jgi:P-type E1-E2 ATPase
LASRLGMLVSDSRVLETTRRVDAVVFDKTGTITWGDFSVLYVPPQDLRLLAAVEAGSEHPLGRAVAARAKAERLAVNPAADIQVVKGQGVRGTVDGQAVEIGTRRFVGESHRRFEQDAAEWEARGCTVAFYAVEGVVQGFLAFGDRLRDDAKPLVDRLRARGIRTLVVSGDSVATTAWMASRVGADECHAEVQPDEKAQLIERLRTEGHIVAMVGDGINDAPALASADLGIALGSGADVAMKAASVVLMHNRLGRVIEIFDMASRTIRVVKQNLFWAFFYNSAGITLAVAGILNPIVAAAGMVLSSTSVVANSYRLTRTPVLRLARRPPT